MTASESATVGWELERLAEAGARHPEPLLSVDELRLLTASTVPAADLEERLHARPDLFRGVDFWRGPLRSLTPVRHPHRPAYRRALGNLGLTSGTRVVCRSPRTGEDAPAEPPSTVIHGRDRAQRLLRDGVAAVARGADSGSFLRLLRLARLVKEEQRLRTRLSRPS